MTDPAPIDCDVHPIVPNIATLMPYLDDHWRETVVRRGIEDLTTIAYPTRNPLSFRQDWRDETGRTATDVVTLGRQALDPFGTRLAICNCLYGVQAQFSEDLGVAFSRALNDWIAKEWLDRDPRLRASIVVPMQNAEMAVDEIERCVPDRRFVQVLLLVGSELLPLFLSEAEPLFAGDALVGVDLGGVLASLEAEHRMPRASEQTCDILVEVSEEGFRVRVRRVDDGRPFPEANARVIEPPPQLILERCHLLGDEPVLGGRTEQRRNERVEVLGLQIPNGPIAIPERRRTQCPTETTPRTAADDQILVAPVASRRGRDHQPASPTRLLVRTKAPGEPESAVRAA